MLANILNKFADILSSEEGERTDIMPAPHGAPIPTEVLIVNLGLVKSTVNPPKRVLEFTGFNTMTVVGPADFTALLNTVAKSGYTVPPPNENTYGRLSARPISSAVSYLVVRLDDELDWRFAEKWITFGVDRSGDIPQHFSHYWGPVRHADNVAYVSVNGPAFCFPHAKTVHKFNFYVNFVGKTQSDDVPIIIDPEIKWPEGNH